MTIKAADLGGWLIIDRSCVAAYRPQGRCHVGSCLRPRQRSGLASSSDRSQSGIRRRCSKNLGKPAALLGSAAALRTAALTTEPQGSDRWWCSCDPVPQDKTQLARPLFRRRAWNPQGLLEVGNDRCAVLGHCMGCDQEGCAAPPAGRLATA